MDAERRTFAYGVSEAAMDALTLRRLEKRAEQADMMLATYHDHGSEVEAIRAHRDLAEFKAALADKVAERRNGGSHA